MTFTSVLMLQSRKVRDDDYYYDDMAQTFIRKFSRCASHTHIPLALLASLNDILIAFSLHDTHND